MDNHIAKRELLFYYIAKGNVDAVRVMVGECVHIDAVIDEGHTPLHKAIVAGSSEIIKVLIAGGADVNAPDMAGHTPLLWATLWDHIAICQQLIDAGADSARSPAWPVNSKKYLSPFQQAVRLGKEEIAYLLFDRFCEDPSQKTLNGIALDRLALQNQSMLQMLQVMHTEYVVRTGIEAGVQTSERRTGGASPL